MTLQFGRRRGVPDALRGGRWVVLLLALAGTVIAVYLTIQHYDASVVLACPGDGAINCEKVTTSEYSKLAGIPVAVLGLLFFASIALSFLPPIARWRRIDQARFVACVIGILVVLYLVWAELFRINAICLWCTAVHVLTLALLGAATWVVLEH